MQKFSVLFLPIQEQKAFKLATLLLLLLTLLQRYFKQKDPYVDMITGMPSL